MSARTASVFCALMLTACASFPPSDSTPVQRALDVPNAAPLPMYAASVLGQRQNSSFVSLVASSEDAYLSRIALIDAAEVSLDIQYFIWQDDYSGMYMFDRLLAAADRGVRVRLLIDDVAVFSRDKIMYQLDQHPGIDVRYFNPWRTRSRLPRSFEYIFRVGTINHRLHNKTIISDTALALIGGRNIGDRYFGLYDVFVQKDLDILSGGKVVEQMVNSFDQYWNAPRSVRIEDHLKPRQDWDSLAALRANIRATATSVPEDVRVAMEALNSLAPQWLALARNQFVVADADFIEDSADIDAFQPIQLRDSLVDLLANAEHEIVISTAYFIPDDELIALLLRLATDGKRIVLLTNSIQSNNHMLAHVGYRRWRKLLVNSGIELYEFRPDAMVTEQYVAETIDTGYAGLHSKAIVVDARWSLVGTPNLDPRALEINTEHAVVVDSPQFAERLRTLILDGTRPENAWRIHLDPQGKIEWRSQNEVLTSEPVRGISQRLLQFFFRLFPFKEQA